MNFPIQTDYKVHEIILQQLGGRQFLAMTGSHHLTYCAKENNYLQMHLTRNRSGAKYLKIVLGGMDTYTMIFTKVKTTYEKIQGIRFPKSHEVIEVCSHEGIYYDMLRGMFTEVTGLYTHL